jgi:hypothetical protein
MKTRENSVVMSVRIERKTNHEFIALCKELGVLPSRMLSQALSAQLLEMRDDANARRQLHGRSSWEDFYNGNKD